MKYLPLLIALLLAGCSTSPGEKEAFATQEMAPAQQRALIQRSIRYLHKLAPRATHETKWDTAHDAYYAAAAATYVVEAYVPAGHGGYSYALISRPARSLYQKRTAIGIRYTLAPDSSFSYYEELFYTWKMKPEELMPKAKEIFSAAASTGDIEKYLPYNLKPGDEWAEFPDALNWYDPQSRTWKMVNDSLTPPAELKKRRLNPEDV